MCVLIALKNFAKGCANIPPPPPEFTVLMNNRKTEYTFCGQAMFKIIIIILHVYVLTALQPEQLNVCHNQNTVIKVSHYR
jgi:hypothetical protein